MAEKNLPGNGFLGWLGRQVGYVKKAVKTNVAQQVVHREQRVQEAAHPEQSNLTLRRTVIDEVIVEKGPARARPDDGGQGVAKR